jgi:hypothetical protein
MGLTIHYSLKSTTKSADKARKLVERMRQLAMDLPFEEVGPLLDLSGDETNYNECRDDSIRWLLIQSRESLRCPWNKRVSIEVYPTRVIAFTAYVGPGCEPVNIGLVQFPSEIEWEYEPEDDQRFQHRRAGQIWHEFSERKFRKWVEKHYSVPFEILPSDLYETRTIRTRLAGWRWGSFCKTQYASDPECGGVPNFLRCHISVITLLERVAELPTVKVDICDEGHYGPATYSDDWREAYAAGRKPTYVPHAATHSVPTLLKELGDYNAMIAAFSGAMKDACGNGFDSPILRYANFEQLEFNGSKSEEVGPFLETMAQLAKSAALEP